MASNIKELKYNGRNFRYRKNIIEFDNSIAIIIKNLDYIQRGYRNVKKGLFEHWLELGVGDLSCCVFFELKEVRDKFYYELADRTDGE